MSKTKKQMKKPIDFTPAEAALLFRLGKECESRAREMESGEKASVELMLDLSGYVMKGQDGQSPRTTKPAAEQFVAWFFEQMTPSARDNLVAKFLADLKANAGEMPQVEGPAMAKASVLVQAASKTKISPRAGSITGTVSVGTVDFASVSTAMRSKIAECVRKIELDRKIDLDFGKGGESDEE